MHSHLLRKIRQALDDHDIVLQRTVTADGVECLGLHLPEEHKIVLATHQSADELVLTLLHEAGHAIGLPEYIVGEAMERQLFRSPTLRWEAARRLLEAFLAR